MLDGKPPSSPHKQSPSGSYADWKLISAPKTEEDLRLAENHCHPLPGKAIESEEDLRSAENHCHPLPSEAIESEEDLR